LDAGDHDPARAVPDGAEEGRGVGLRAARGEDDLVLGRPDQPGDVGARLLDRSAGSLSLGADGRRGAEGLVRRRPRRPHRGLEPGRRVVVEVDHAFRFSDGPSNYRSGFPASENYLRGIPKRNPGVKIASPMKARNPLLLVFAATLALWGPAAERVV